MKAYRPWRPFPEVEKAMTGAREEYQKFLGTWKEEEEALYRGEHSFPDVEEAFAEEGLWEGGKELAGFLWEGGIHMVPGMVAAVQAMPHIRSLARRGHRKGTGPGLTAELTSRQEMRRGPSPQRPSSPGERSWEQRPLWVSSAPAPPWGERPLVAS